MTLAVVSGLGGGLGSDLAESACRTARCRSQVAWPSDGALPRPQRGGRECRDDRGLEPCDRRQAPRVG